MPYKTILHQIISITKTTYVQNSAQSLITRYETFAQICTSTHWKLNSFYRVYKYSKTSVDGSCTMYQC